MGSVNNKDPAFLFYSSDFMIGTMDMTDEEVGKYIRLLCRQHLKGNIHPKFMGDLSEEILSKFVQDNQGNYYNKRLKHEIDRRRKYTESRRSNGCKGGRPSKAKGKLNESTEKPYGYPCDNHTENVNENENETETEIKAKMYGEFGNVKLSEEELEKLKERFPYDWRGKIDDLSSYMASKGKRYKSHYATILNWARKEGRDANGEKTSGTEKQAEGTGGNGDAYEKFFE